MADKIKQHNHYLREERERRGWTQKDVANKVDLPDVRTYRRWESGEAFPSLRYRAKLCELFDASAEELGLIPSTDPVPSSLSTTADQLQPKDVQSSDGSDELSVPFSQKRSMPSKRRLPSSSDWNRRQLLKKVQAFWINNVLQKSLLNGQHLTLQLCEEPEAITNAWTQVIPPQKEPVHFIPRDTPIIQIYDEACGELLILGEPGAGKTTLLLEIARNLLQRAVADESYPIPVVFNLSTWSLQWPSLQEWFVNELNAKYQVPFRVGRKWVEDDCILPLLDGLDEVDISDRKTCVDAITTYRQAHGLVPMVICSGRQEYLDLETRLLLQKAIYIQPLTQQQIDEFFANGSNQMAALRSAFQDVQDLQELLTTPLMLHVLESSLQNRSIADLKGTKSSETLRQQVFTMYIESMLKHRQIEHHYALPQCIHWLSYLARQMKRHYQTEFYFERMQVDWLPSRLLQQLCYGLVAGFWAGLIGGVLVGFTALPLEDSIIKALVIMPIITLVVGLATGVMGAMLEHIWSTPLLKMGVGSLAGVIVGSGVTWLGEALNWSSYLLIGPAIGVVIVLVFILLSRQKTASRPTKVLSRSWKKQLQNIASSPSKAIVLCIGIGIMGSFASAFVAKLDVLRIVMIVFFGTVTFLINMFLNIFAGKRPGVHYFEHRNQGTRHSAFNAVCVGAVTSLLNGLLLAAIGLLMLKMFPQLWISTDFIVCNILVYALLAGLITGMYRGGDACFKYLLLRLMLCLKGYTPWNYTRFLDYVAECLLLRKVCGGYIFAHSLFLDYFASLAEPSS